VDTLKLIRPGEWGELAALVDALGGETMLFVGIIARRPTSRASNGLSLRIFVKNPLKSPPDPLEVPGDIPCRSPSHLVLIPGDLA